MPLRIVFLICDSEDSDQCKMTSGVSCLMKSSVFCQDLYQNWGRDRETNMSNCLSTCFINGIQMVDERKLFCLRVANRKNIQSCVNHFTCWWFKMSDFCLYSKATEASGTRFMILCMIQRSAVASFAFIALVGWCLFRNCTFQVVW